MFAMRQVPMGNFGGREIKARDVPAVGSGKQVDGAESEFEPGGGRPGLVYRSIKTARHDFVLTLIGV
jgi:hypothetical protein